jgi:hypothetical protein
VGDAAQVESLICGPFPSGVSSIPGGVWVNIHKNTKNINVWGAVKPATYLKDLAHDV